MMKKVLCIIESLGSGGAERQMSGLAMLLKQRGYEVEVWMYYPQDFYRGKLEDAGIKCRFVKRARNKFIRIPVLSREVKKWNPDVVITYLPTASSVGCVLKRLGVIKRLIVSERNTSQNYGLRERFRFLLYRMAADWVVPNSYSQAQFIKDKEPKLEKRIKVITNFVDTDYFSPGNESPRDSEDLRMVCVGRVMQQKNILPFIQAFSKARADGVNISVDWYGQNLNDNYYDECAAAIKELRLDDNFRFHAPSSNIVECYRNANVFCLPSIYEGFPNVLCEAMSCGLPILCGRVCDNPRIVEEGANGFLFDPYSIDDIVNGIKKIYNTSFQELKQIGINNRNKSLKMFSTDAFIDKYLHLMEKFG